jgi:uncharacterized membrane protein YdjX (TVP38/TMEM64 family)
MSHQGILAIMLIRIVPVAPYSVVNVIRRRGARRACSST